MSGAVAQGTTRDLYRHRTSIQDPVPARKAQTHGASKAWTNHPLVHATHDEVGMSDTLRAALAARQAVRQLRQLLSPHQISAEVVDDSTLQNRLATAATQVLSLQTAPEGHLSQRIRPSEPPGMAHYAVATDGVAPVRLFEADPIWQSSLDGDRVSPHPHWLVQLWESLTVPDVLIEDQTLTAICAIFGEEHVIEYHVHVLTRVLALLVQDVVKEFRSARFCSTVVHTPCRTACTFAVTDDVSAQIWTEVTTPPLYQPAFQSPQ